MSKCWRSIGRGFVFCKHNKKSLVPLLLVMFILFQFVYMLKINRQVNLLNDQIERNYSVLNRIQASTYFRR